MPKNDFGNLDLYTPSMLPKGGVHIPCKSTVFTSAMRLRFPKVKGAAKIAKKLGFDYAEAVTGFEFKKRRAFPIVSGIVIAAENEELLLEVRFVVVHYIGTDFLRQFQGILASRARSG